MTDNKQRTKTYQCNEVAGSIEELQRQHANMVAFIAAFDVAFQRMFDKAEDEIKARVTSETMVQMGVYTMIDVMRDRLKARHGLTRENE